MKKTDTGEYPVHPLAAIFPLLDEAELADLAADIKAHGLRFAIMLDHAGEVLIDGRNRAEACRLAGVEPRFERLDAGQDPVAYIWSANIARRHLSKGQIAMAAARVRSFSEQTQRQAAKLSKVSIGRIAQADIVLQFAPDLADAVVAGATPLNDAYEVANRRKQEGLSTEARMRRLRTAAPELADLVIEERLTLKAAEIEVEERAAQVRQIINTGRNAAEELARVNSRISDVSHPRRYGAKLITQEMVDAVAAAAKRLAELFAEQENR